VLGTARMLLSMLLFALCLNPLLQILEQNLPGIRISRRARKTVVVAYADDITIFVTAPEDIPVMLEAIRCYEMATGACLNTRRSKALAVGGWNTTSNALDIPRYSEIRILGFSITSTVKQSANRSWVNITGRVRAEARTAYGRDLRLSQRILYVHSYLLAKFWHTAQVFPAPRSAHDSWFRR
jgi:hypothetical protein